MAETQGAAPPPPEQDPDLTGRAMGAIDQLVDTIHDKVIRPILLVGRSIAFSFIIVFAVAVVSVGLGVGLMRFMNIYLFAAHQWLSWALLGAVSLAGGLYIWRRRTMAPTRSTPAK